MTTKQEFLEGLKDMLYLEQKALENYTNEKITFRNELLVKTLEEISKDEKKHIKLIKEMIELLEK